MSDTVTFDVYQSIKCSSFIAFLQNVRQNRVAPKMCRNKKQSRLAYCFTTILKISLLQK